MFEFLIEQSACYSNYLLWLSHRVSACIEILSYNRESIFIYLFTISTLLGDMLLKDDDSNIT